MSCNSDILVKLLYTFKLLMGMYICFFEYKLDLLFKKYIFSDVNNTRIYLMVEELILLLLLLLLWLWMLELNEASVLLLSLYVSLCYDLNKGCDIYYVSSFLDKYSKLMKTTKEVLQPQIIIY